MDLNKDPLTLDRGLWCITGTKDLTINSNASAPFHANGVTIYVVENIKVTINGGADLDLTAPVDDPTDPSYATPPAIQGLLIYMPSSNHSPLTINGGSDFHGDNKPEVGLGNIRSRNRLTYNLVTALKADDGAPHDLVALKAGDGVPHNLVTDRDGTVRVANEGVQIFGGYGFVKDYPAEKFFRDVKLLTIATLQHHLGTGELFAGQAFEHALAVIRIDAELVRSR